VIIVAVLRVIVVVALVIMVVFSNRWFYYLTFLGKPLWYDLHGARNAGLETSVALMVKHVTQDFKRG
jgi:hypothetical protein